MIGQVHDNTRPALAVLNKEGFEFEDLVDIFDGGPTVHCERENIRTIRESRTGTVKSIKQASKSQTDSPPSTKFEMISNCQLDYRCCMGEINWSGAGAEIDEASARGLNLTIGDAVRSVTIR